jgi:tetraacyldisaccharide 4'-kinase
MLKDRLMEIMSSSRPYPFFSMATLLHGGSIVYGWVIRQRRKWFEQGWLRSHRLPCTVVSVGNLTVGGTGKTPIVVHLAKRIQSNGYRVVIISRGYKGLMQQKQGAVVSDGNTIKCSARQSGDEPYLMAMLLDGVPVVVGKDRYSAGKVAVSRFKPDVILLDDAFQHLQLKRDLNLLLLDARLPFGNSFLLPRGRLREPVAALSKADAVILTRSDMDTNAHLSDMMGSGRHLPVFRSVHKSMIRGVACAYETLPPLNELSVDVPRLTGIKAFGFAGLANNQIFFDTLGQLGANLLGTLAFEDHHAYGDEEVAHIARTAMAAGAQWLVTTDKDYVRLNNKLQLPLDLVVIGVDIEFIDDAARWRQYITERIDCLVRSGKAS